MHDATFRKNVLDYWRTKGRHKLPWRETTDPYGILVSEFMLQQTQVERVIPYYRAFVERFPSFERLARARQGSVLKSWQGLGYNRRALNLHRCARTVVTKHGGALPDSFEGLQALPGIGPYTAGAILAFAFNRAYPVIETNIRRTYLYHFFPNRQRVNDADILEIVERTLDRRNPRRWYAALMDYGAFLATRTDNPNRRSKHYARQTVFQGSDRQIRGSLLRRLLSSGPVSEHALFNHFDISKSRFSEILASLEHEGFIERAQGKVRCA